MPKVLSFNFPDPANFLTWHVISLLTVTSQNRYSCSLIISNRARNNNVGVSSTSRRRLRCSRSVLHYGVGKDNILVPSRSTENILLMWRSKGVWGWGSVDNQIIKYRKSKHVYGIDSFVRFISAVGCYKLLPLVWKRVTVEAFRYVWLSSTWDDWVISCFRHPLFSSGRILTINKSSL